jgi:hypothetical protein
MRDTAMYKVSEQLVFAILATLFIAVVDIPASRGHAASLGR